MSAENITKVYTRSASEFAKGHLFYVELSGEYDGIRDYEIIREKYESLLVMHILSGALTLTVNGQTSIAEKDSFVFLDCRSPHHYHSKEPISFKWIHLQGNAVYAYAELLEKRFGMPAIIHTSSMVLQEFKLLFGLLKGEQNLEHSISVMVHRLLASISERVSGQTKTMEQALITAEAYLRQNFDQQIAITDVANEVDMSVYHFSRQFHNQYGISPYEYLIMQRISNAKKLLLNTSLSTKKISEACGYNNSSTFIAAFKTRVGMTPSQFRENIINNVGI